MAGLGTVLGTGVGARSGETLGSGTFPVSALIPLNVSMLILLSNFSAVGSCKIISSMAAGTVSDSVEGRGEGAASASLPV